MAKGAVADIRNSVLYKLVHRWIQYRLNYPGTIFPSMVEMLVLGMKANRRTVQAGETIVKSGELSSSLYFVEDGKCMAGDGKKVFANIESGNCFGEWGMVMEVPSSCDVSASVSSVVCECSGNNQISFSTVQTPFAI